ncbi:TraR/DksA C4-type zinc finger protein [Leisingera sp. JC11]|uniref:TraR/DksA family transcriptional regulator n=1 Tax=Leisingera sp. JC11 TaxID=3042469 RepID=UPI003451DF74
MDFSARRELLEARRQQLAGLLSRAGAAPAAARMGSRRQPRAERGAGCAIEVLPWASLEELRRIEAALARLREGSYGYCRICGDDIGDDWLDQRPASPFCKSCAL